jgi:hypothetical protein
VHIWKSQAEEKKLFENSHECTGLDEIGSEDIVTRLVTVDGVLD